LMAEILYDANVSPFRTTGSLSDNEILAIGRAMKYITKLSYYDNMTGYMTNFESFIPVHKERVKKGIYPDYHDDVKIKKGDTFEFKVYRQKKDPLGNPVSADKTIQKGRSTYWVPGVQV